MKKLLTTLPIIAAIAGFLGLARLAYGFGYDQGRTALELRHVPDADQIVDLPDLVAQLDVDAGGPIAAPSLAPPATPVAAPAASSAPTIGPGPAAPPPDAAADPVGFLGTVWQLWQRGLVTPALMLLFHLANTIALARWAWLSGHLPWLANGRWLAVVSAIQGATTGLVPLAVAGDLTAAAIAAAALTALAQYFRPTPKVVVVPTEPGAPPQRIERVDMAIELPAVSR